MREGQRSDKARRVPLAIGYLGIGQWDFAIGHSCRARSKDHPLLTVLPASQGVNADSDKRCSAGKLINAVTDASAQPQIGI